MTQPLRRISTSIESLLDSAEPLSCDVLVIGSGYGGSFAALELAGLTGSVWVIERGNEYAPGEFSESLEDAIGDIQFTRDDDEPARGNPDALFDVRTDDDCVAVVACGLGGGSLINAGVVIAPTDETLNNILWPEPLRKNHDELKRHFPKIKEILGAEPYPNASEFDKYQALARISEHLPGTEIRPAEIAVTSKAGKNAVGVHQDPCVNCGNCVTGCNYNAKNTLTTNVIRLAKQRGARCFTGAYAVKIEKNSGNSQSAAGRPLRWRVKMTRTAVYKNKQSTEIFDIQASHVIVAAGSLGSTELLLRSRSSLNLSATLGERFSANGDTLAFGFAQGDPVNAVVERIKDTDSFKPTGPTILGVVRYTGTATESENQFPSNAMLQDGNFPYALSAVTGTLLTTLGMTYQLTHDDPPQFYKDRQSLDPIGLHPDVQRHTQVLLGMGIDEGSGTIRLRPSHSGRFEKIRMSLPFGNSDKTLNGIHNALKAAEKNHGFGGFGGFDGGYYVANPLWRLLPDGSGEVAGDIKSTVLTVHPIGGCPMGENHRTGTVDHYGKVFNAMGPRTDSTYDGLHVLDGAIIPVPLGANPLLTISALAIRSAQALGKQLGVPMKRATMVSEELAEVFQPHRPDLPLEDKTEIRFKEVLYTASGNNDKTGFGPLVTDRRIRRGEPEAAEIKPKVKPLLRKLIVCALWAKHKSVDGVDDPHSYPNNLPDGWWEKDLPNEWTRDFSDGRLKKRLLDGENTSEIETKASEIMADLRNETGKFGFAVRFDVHNNLADWLRDPATEWKGNCNLAIFKFPDGTDAFAQATGHWPTSETDPLGSAPKTHVDLTLLGVCKGKASLQLFKINKPKNFDDFEDRVDGALSTYQERRRWGADTAVQFRQAFNDTKAPFCADPAFETFEPKLAAGGETSRGEDFSYFNRAASMHTGWRELRYDANLTGPAGENIVLVGRKLLAYYPTQKTVWDALLQMKIDIWLNGVKVIKATMRVDLLELLRANVYQFEHSANTVNNIVNLINVGGLWLRALGSSHYWSFRGFHYNVKPPVPTDWESLSTIKLKDQTKIPPTDVLPFHVQRGGDKYLGPEEPTQVRLRVTRYASPKERKQASLDNTPILLIHGLAHGGEVFTTDTIPRNMASYFVEQGRDVWVLDHRLSNFLPTTAKLSGNIDQIAEFDIPNAMKTIFDHPTMVGQSSIDVFAHCIGACAFSMAVLKGHIDDTIPNDRSIRRVVLHAVHPWVVPSPWNRVSGAIAAFYRDILSEDVIDPIPPVTSKGFDQLIDRLGASIPWQSGDSEQQHRDFKAECDFGHAICNRMTLFYGREWIHENLEEKTIADMHRLVGPVHLDMFQHMFYITQRQRLTNKDGEDVYLSADQFKKYWRFDTLFATGKQNRVFDPRSAAKSKLLTELVLRSDSDATTSGPKIGWYAPNGVGHMDFIFGKNAASEYKKKDGGSGIYRQLTNFFNNPAVAIVEIEKNARALEKDAPKEQHVAIPEDFVPDHHTENTPLCGNIISYEVTPDGNDNYRAKTIRIHNWFELRPYGTGDLSSNQTIAIEAQSKVDVSLPNGINFLSRRYELIRNQNLENKISLPGRFIDRLLTLDIDALTATAAKSVDTQETVPQEIITPLPILATPPRFVSQSEAKSLDIDLKKIAMRQGTIRNALATLAVVREESENSVLHNPRTIQFIADFENRFDSIGSNDDSANSGRKLSGSELVSQLELLGRAYRVPLNARTISAKDVNDNLFNTNADFEALVSKGRHQRSVRGTAAREIEELFQTLAGRLIEEEQRILAELIDYLDRSSIHCITRFDPPWVGRLGQLLEGKGRFNSTTRILVGSCRWPGIFVENAEIDDFFGKMETRAPDSDALWLVGDQIYSDAVADVFDTTESKERTASRYRRAFTADARYEELYYSKRMRSIMSQLPTWMVIDDHEFSDNWSGIARADNCHVSSRRQSVKDVELENFKTKFNAAIAYQWRRFVTPDQTSENGRPDDKLNPSVLCNGKVERGFWHQFYCTDLPCFAMDTRSERAPYSNDPWSSRTIVGPDQMIAVGKWLEDHCHWPHPKFILCGSAFGLLRKSELDDASQMCRADDWTGYPKSMADLLAYVVETKTKNLVIVSGDPHLSCIGTITVNDGKEEIARIHSVVSSGLNATLPFANATSSDYVGDGVSSESFEFPSTVLKLRMPGRSPYTVRTNIQVLSEAPRQFGELEIIQDQDVYNVTFHAHSNESAIKSQTLQFKSR